jgi:type II secretory pathway predicted ATPase ExeA
MTSIPGCSRSYCATELKRLMELVHNQGDRLSMVLAGHPKLQHDLWRPAMEEIGARAIVFILEGIKGYQHDYIVWLLEQLSLSRFVAGAHADAARGSPRAPPASAAVRPCQE